MTSALKGLVRGTTLDRLLKIFQSEGEVVSESALLEELTAEEILEIELAPEVFLPIIATTVLMSPTARNKINQLVRETIARNPDRVREERKTDDQLGKKFTNAVNNAIRRNRIRFADPVRREETGADDPPIPLEDIPVPTETPPISPPSSVSSSQPMEEIILNPSLTAGIINRPPVEGGRLDTLRRMARERQRIIRERAEERRRERRLPRARFRGNRGIAAGVGGIASAVGLRAGLESAFGTDRQRFRPIPTQRPPPPTQPPPTQPPPTQPPPTQPPVDPPITAPTQQTNPEETFPTIFKHNLASNSDLRPEFVSLGTTYFDKSPLEMLEDDLEWVEFDYIKPQINEENPFKKLDDDKVRFMEPLFYPDRPEKPFVLKNKVIRGMDTPFNNVIQIKNNFDSPPKINIGFSDQLVLPQDFHKVELLNP